MNRSPRNLRRWPFLLGLALLAGCDTVLETEAQERGVLEGLGPGIHPIVVLTSQSGGNATVAVHLKRVQVTTAVASYQGELSYDANLLKLAGAELPQGIVGAWNEVMPGQVRFAGAAMNGVGEGPILTLRFTSAGAIKAEAFKIRLEEVVGATDFANVTKEVVPREQPLFSETPLK